MTTMDIIAILMKRDKISYEDARDLVKETGWQIADVLDAEMGSDGAEKVLQELLNLGKEYLTAVM